VGNGQRNFDEGERMTYFKVDDGIWGHPKFALLSNDAVSLWVMAGSWCGRYVTDGLVPFQTLTLIRGSKQAAQELVDAGLWLETPNGWLFHDWEDYQYTKAEIESRRAYDRVKKRKQRERVVEQEELSLGVSPGESPGVSLRESPACPGEGEGEGKGIGSIKNKNEKFEEFWSAYPLKTGKKAARLVWDRVVSTVNPDEVTAGAMRYRDDPNRDPQFTAHARTWLNQGRWEDEPMPERRVTRTLTAGERRMDSYRDLFDKVHEDEREITQ